MKKTAAVLMVIVLMMTFLTGCAKDRKLYRKVKLENYVSVENYVGIEVDTTTDAFAKEYDNIYALDIQDNELYTKIEDGVVADGDIINLDYEGKLDGVAFEGGTAKGATLEIGSGTFIDDFEEELIGAKIGETRDITAKFPEKYHAADLAGKEAIFTCKINGIERPMTEEEAYSEMDFNSAQEYKENIKKRAIENTILKSVMSKAKISDYPQEDKEIIGNAIYEFYLSAYSLTAEQMNQMLAQQGYTTDTFKSDVATEMMNTNMIMYYILDVEGLTIVPNTDNSNSIKQPVIAESYDVQDTVMKYLYENAIIK